MTIAHLARRLVLLFSVALGLALGAQAARAAEPASAPQPDGGRFQIPSSDVGLPGAGPIRQADWFKKIWLERRSSWASQVQQDQGSIVFLGDSITQGWGTWAAASQG